MTTFYLLLWCTFILNSFCYWSVYRLIARTTMLMNITCDGPTTEFETLLRLMRTLRWYPLFCVLSWGPSSVYRVSEEFGARHDKSLASVFVILYGPAVQSVLNAIAFFATPAVSRLWTNKMINCFSNDALREICCCLSKNVDGVQRGDVLLRSENDVQANMTSGCAPGQPKHERIPQQETEGLNERLLCP